MKAQNYLEQVDKLEAIIQNKMIEKEQWRDIAQNITGRYEGERVQSSGSQSKMADAADRMILIDAEIDRLIGEQIETRLDIIRTIEQLKVDDYDVLHKIYIQHKSFKEVAAAKNKSVSWATTIHGRALQALQKILDARKL